MIRAIAAPLLGRQAHGAVEADHLAVDHHVLDDGTHQLRKLVRPAEPRRKGRRLAERILHVLLKIEKCVEVIESFIAAGIEQTMATFNNITVKID